MQYLQEAGFEIHVLLPLISCYAQTIKVWGE